MGISVFVVCGISDFARYQWFIGTNLFRYRFQQMDCAMRVLGRPAEVGFGMLWRQSEKMMSLEKRVGYEMWGKGLREMGDV
jgi:hypothetical protein